MTIKEFSELALTFPGTMAVPHFDRTAFKIANKRIFTTVHENGTANVKLSPADQKIFCEYKKEGIYPVPNKWGLQGWTTFELNKASRALMLEALESAYKEVLNPSEKT